MTALQSSEYVIRRSVDKELPITNLKLQKTLYYLQGYFLRVFGEPIFDDDILHWQYGPVVPTVYFKYSINGSSILQIDESVSLPQLPKAKRALFENVVDKCLETSTRTLVDMTHSEAPWQGTNRNEIITTNAIMRYFCAHNPLDLNQE